jgi:hypothetical protein
MSAPVLTVVTYTARPGCEEQLEGILRTHVARLRELGLVADEPAWVGAALGQHGTFLESFWWQDAGSARIAEDSSEIQEIWMRAEDLCVQGGIKHQTLRLLA